MSDPSVPEVEVALLLGNVSLVVESVAGRGRTRAVERTTVLDQVSLAVRRGQCLGIVAESGAGADALVRVAGGILAPTSGEVTAPRGRPGAVQVVLANAEAGVDARATVEDHVGWMTASLDAETAVERRARTLDVLATVGLFVDDLDRPVASLPASDRRRALLARAAAAAPELLILEHLTAGLGPIDRGQVLDAVGDVRRELGCAVLVHDADIAFTTSVSDRCAVLHGGRVVEIGATPQVVGAPAHPYARALFDALPTPRARAGAGEVDRPRATLPTAEPPTGCRFHPRCTHADDRCAAETPELTPTALHGGSHLAACFHPVS